MTVAIRPKFAKALFIPTWGAENGFVFASDAVGGAGGEETTGAFTAQWTTWWATVAPAIFDRNVKRTVEQDLGMAERELGRAVGRKGNRRKSFTLGGVTDNRAAFKNGRLMAEEYIRRKAQSYSAAASAAAAKSAVYGGSNF